jgi:murein DD-endopeptidase MepM/ murein hydrolase activator NlpD
VDHRQPRGRYHGRRRVPAPPRSRYAAVITTAFVSAGVVALGAGIALPDMPHPSGLSLVDVSVDGRMPADLAARGAGDRASRSDPRSSGDTTTQAAPDVWVLPLRSYTLSSPFGPRWGRMHTGYDLAAPYGTQYRAAARGKVVLADYYGGYGNCIIIDHGEGVSTVYGHSSSIQVKVGQVVEAGDVIGRVGNTGHSFGPHLHFEVRTDNTPINPVPWMQAHGVDIVGHSDPMIG